MKKTELINLFWDKKETRTVLLADIDERELVVWTEWIKKYISWIDWRLIQSPKSFLKSTDEIKTSILWKTYSLVEIISIIISDFKKKMESTLDTDVDSVLIWRPVNFHDTDIKLDNLAQNRLESAAKLAWFKNIEFQIEPLAAARSYQSSFNEWKEEKIFIVDLWWWTSDFSILNITNDKIEVIWNGWVYIWWNDFDKRLSYDFFSEYLWKWSFYSVFWKSVEVPKSYFHTLSDWKKIHLLWVSKNRQNAREIFGQSLDKIKFWRILEIINDHFLWYEYFDIVEKTKIALTKYENYNWNLGFLSNSFDFSISRNKFDEIIYYDIEKIIKIINELLLQSWLNPTKIDKIFLTWWSSLVPFIRNSVENILWKWKIIEGDTFTSVWYWLALESYDRF